MILKTLARGSDDTQNTTTDKKALLKIFSKIYPLAREKWLTEDELQLIENVPCDPQDNQRRNDLDLSPKEQWTFFKKAENVHSLSMDKLMDFIGWKKIKIVAFEIFKLSLALKKMPIEAREENLPQLNFCFLGNPGTGKTTAARLFAEILCECGLRTKPDFTETSAQMLKDNGPAKFRNQLKQAHGGTFFIDEAYDLDPSGDAQGKAIISELLVASEKERKNLSIFLAGYEDDISNKLFAYNEGLKSRFQCIIFDDFDENELLQIWNYELNRKCWNADENVGQLVVRKLSKLANRKGFGNARAVRQKIEQATRKACARPDWHGEMRLVLEDVAGCNPMKNEKVQKVLKDIDGMIGWKQIKKCVKELVSISEKNYELELKGMPTLPLNLNRLFLGNPGTGKTKFAEFYGTLLKHLNFLSIGDVVLKTASDFIGGYIGESQKKANSIIDNARGKVLVIDEAYALNDNLYGKQVLDVLVEKVQGTENDDISVILIGYDEQINQMLRNQNPGLMRRFPKESAFIFEDFSDEELLLIWNKFCQKNQVESSSYHVAEKLIFYLTQKRNCPEFEG